MSRLEFCDIKPVSITVDSTAGILELGNEKREEEKRGEYFNILSFLSLQYLTCI